MNTTAESQIMANFLQVDDQSRIKGVDKVARYNWVCQDQPGVFRMIDKTQINIEPTYQRDLTPASTAKILRMASEWSWVSFGAIPVSERNGSWWAIDGQHRVMAALRRSDISLLPCMIYPHLSVADEAKSFLTINTGRKPINSISRHKARLAAGDESSLFVSEAIASCGLKIPKSQCSKTPMSVNCLALCYKLAEMDRPSFKTVLSLTTELMVEANFPSSLPNRILDGLFYIDRMCGHAGLKDRRLTLRIKAIGINRLILGANRAASLYAAGGAKIWAQGMLEEINKGLQYKFVLQGN